MPTDPTIIRDLARAHGLDIITDSIVINELGLDFQVATGRMPLARPDVQAPQKPESYSEDEIAVMLADVEAEYRRAQEAR